MQQMVSALAHADAFHSDSCDVDPVDDIVGRPIVRFASLGAHVGDKREWYAAGDEIRLH